jgi:MFS family permease
MGATNFFTVASFGTFFLFPLFVQHYGGSKADIGIVMGAFALSSVLCRPWISEMIDRIGRKRSYGIGSGVMTLLPLTYLLLQGSLDAFYLPLLLIRIVHGVGLALCFTAVFTYVADIVPPARLNEGIGIFGVTGLTGLAVGPFVAEVVILRLGFTPFFLTAAGLAAAGFLLHLFLPETYRDPQRQNRSVSFFSVLTKRKIAVIAAVAGLFGFALAASSGFVSPYAKTKALALISLYYLAYSLAAVMSRLFGGRIADRVGEERVIPYALAVTGLGLVVLVFLKGEFLLIVSGLLTGCGHGFLFPCLNSLAIRDEPIHIRGKINGVYTGGMDAGAFVGSIALGYIGEWAGYPTLFLAAGMALFVGLGIFLWMWCRADSFDKPC